MKRKLFIAVGLLMLSYMAVAQQSPTNPGGFLNTDPRSPAYNPGLAAPPRPAEERWADRWGAIASDGDVTYGIVTDKVSKDEAKHSALAECKKRGGGACSIERYFVNQCAAVIAGDGATASSNAPTVEEAVEIGMPICRENGGENCHVYYSGCSFPARLD
ncbi:DUF4189 domain-containing protein [Pseudoxanthomonas sacheonensis]|uniref:DUF4189 domain-containing protein n=1 Tax=Pseudoxanthomonas sacheonensis TaxID=443615 RepID=A0ABU1RWW7_9GAMM|nr:DUF4189 domain-containing protein [Pseudoxanthomonas sacheonensis]MDR6843249.1 hypothetical protein [Pseudoxanthomonas sacheonensis]